LLAKGTFKSGARAPETFTMVPDLLKAYLQAWYTAVQGRMEFRLQPVPLQFAALVTIADGNRRQGRDGDGKVEREARGGRALLTRWRFNKFVAATFKLRFGAG